MRCFFVTDLHGHIRKYEALFKCIREEVPDLVFIGGDLFAGGFFSRSGGDEDAVDDILAEGLKSLKKSMGSSYPRIFAIMGNDDPKSREGSLLELEKQGLWNYINQKHVSCKGIGIYGYNWVPPSPFLNKDWERYDVSAYVDIGCVAPDEGYHSTDFSLVEARHRTIAEDLQELTEGRDLSHSVMLFHAPPYQTGLDRAALDGKMIDHVPLDVHVGSIAIRRFIEERQPLVTLHGHIHESYDITGVFREKMGKSICLSAVGKTASLVLVRFDTDNPELAERAEIG